MKGRTDGGDKGKEGRTVAWDGRRDGGIGGSVLWRNSRLDVQDRKDMMEGRMVRGYEGSKGGGRDIR